MPQQGLSVVSSEPLEATPPPSSSSSKLSVVSSEPADISIPSNDMDAARQADLEGGFPFTLQSGESPEHMLGRVIEYGHNNPDKLTNLVKQSGESGKQTLKEQGPPIGAMIATGGVGGLEESPWWMGTLLKMGLAGVGGATGAAITGQPIKQSAAEQAGFEAGGQLINKGYSWISNWAKMANGGIVPKETLDYLESKGIHLTAGERMGPGFLSSAENVIGGTALGAKPASKVVQSRQSALVSEADRLASTMSPQAIFPSTPATSGASRGGIQDMAREALGNSDLGSAITNARIAAARGGLPLPSTPGETGNVILDAVRGQFNVSNWIEAQAHEQSGRAIEDAGVQIPVIGTKTQQTAKELYDWARGIYGDVGKAPVEVRPLMTQLYNLSGDALKDKEAGRLMNGVADYHSLSPAMQQRVDEVIASGTSSIPFNDFKSARGDIGSMIGQLQDRGIFDDKRLGVVKNLYNAMSSDMTTHLPNDLKPMFELAQSLTREQKDMFGSRFISSMLRHDPVSGEAVVNQLLRRGNETDINSLMRIVGNDPESKTALQHATSQWLTSNFTDSQSALKMLDNRPGLRTMLGDDYNLLRSKIADEASKEITPEEKAYQTFLGGVFRGKDADSAIATASKSPVYADALKRLTTGNPQLQSRVATDMIGHVMDTASDGLYGLPGAKLNNQNLLSNLINQREALSRFVSPATLDNLTQFAKDGVVKDAFQDMLQKSTTGGEFGSQGAAFNAKKFSELWSESRGGLSKLMDTNTLDEVDKFAKAGGYMTFQPSGATPSGKIGTLRQLAFAGAGISWLLTGTPITGLMAGAATNLGPRALVQFTTSEYGSKLLAEGIRLPVISQQAAPFTLRALSAIAGMAKINTPSNNGNSSNVQ